jgi:hypothetical protein
MPIDFSIFVNDQHATYHELRDGKTSKLLEEFKKKSKQID